MKPQPQTDIDLYVPVTFPDALGLKFGENTLHLQVDYTKGGLNYFSGGRIRRGYRFTVSGIKIENGMKSFVIGGSGYGRCYFLAEAARFDARKLQALYNAIAPHFDAIQTLALVADYDGIHAILTTAASAVFPAKEASPAA